MKDSKPAIGPGDHPACSRRPFSVAEWSGFLAFFLYLPLWMVDPRLAPVPLAGFILACLVLPFFPELSFFLPVISRGRTGRSWVSLTFDDGPDPVSTPLLLPLLERYGATATFFVTGDRASRYPENLREILARGHGIGNHSYTHDDYIMFRNPDTIVGEIDRTQQVFSKFGFLACLFRPPVGIITSRYADALPRTGLQAVNFSRRARDLGNRRVHGLARRILRNLQADDIILLHDIPPRRVGNLPVWLSEVESVLAGIKEKGLTVVSLDTLIGQPVMVALPGPGEAKKD
ncbi:MAG: polysaccharide deacetylase family protein [Desulfocapsaceae bacterium]|nr:polysaccharide deacetylase family protein [Desulfocapsaceae bacterium]